jgi:ABC-type phosphate/phosphonate transport system ATPase subunit
MELHNTLFKMPLKVSVIGDAQIGKKTFLRSLSLNDSEVTGGIYKISVNDIKNNV